MSEIPMFDIPKTATELLAIRELGLTKARELAGDDAVLEVEVVEGADLDGHPAYRFTVLIDPPLIEHKLGHLGLGRFLIQMHRNIRGELFARRDLHEVRVRPLDRTDWPRRNGDQ